MNVEINGSPILTTLPIFGGIPLTATLVVTWSIMLLLTLFCIWLTHDLRVDHVTTRQTVAEFLVNTAQNFVDSNMGTRFSHYAPFVAAIFSLSLLSSLSGLLGVFSPTADLSTELAWAVLVFVLITATKIKTNGIGGYLKGYTQPIAVLTRSISSARSRPPFRWRSVTSAILSPALSSAPLSMPRWELPAMRCSGCCPASWGISFLRSRSFRSVFPPYSLFTLTGSPALCRRSSSACSP